MTYRRFSRSVSLLAVLMTLGSCAPTIDQRGNLPDQDQLALIREGKSTRDDVRDLLGTPSSTGTFGAETWYYISAKTQNYAFFSTEVLEQKVIAISFKRDGIVDKVAEVDPKQAKDVEPVDRTTPTAGKDLGILEQFLGNLGKFNKDRK